MTALSFRQGSRRQRGFTMVEIMVVMLIGLFLMGGLLRLVQDNRRTFKSQNSLAQLQDSERLAMSMLTDIVQQAGYFPNPTANTATSAIIGNNGLAAGQPLSGTFSGTAPGDTITVQYATNSGDGILNCSGSPNTSGGVVSYTSVFSVSNGQLVCTQTAGNATTPYTLVGTDKTLANGIVVTNLSVLYGINTTGSTDTVNEYVTAPNVPNWSNVISAQITLTFVNPLYMASGANVGQGIQAPTLSIQRFISVMNQTGI
ncbi:MAG TPA: prepilin-type N-terminal cleavage/methylation domain-containing protein [Steroidobacteraceae bacterium]|jgi:type IV pilus assembly protein PilW